MNIIFNVNPFKYDQQRFDNSVQDGLDQNDDAFDVYINTQDEDSSGSFYILIEALFVLLIVLKLCSVINQTGLTYQINVSGSMH